MRVYEFPENFATLTTWKRFQCFIFSACHMVELSFHFLERPPTGKFPVAQPVGFWVSFFFLPAIMANQPTPSPKEPPGEIWPLLIRACENHWFPLMLGRLWAPYFWGRLTSHGFNEDPTMLRLPWHLAICQGNQWLLPRNLTWLDGKSTMNEWRCISYWR